ncbi:hypothetical protein [Bdellovibrio sp.]|jgi:hypothetical protein|uniref:hypothetical protein n=1 Tax=Bdellovibrio TaxID=958 RepID=UPI003221769C
MSDELKNFLKENASPAPPSPLGEEKAIWRKIEDKKRKRRAAWLVLVPLMTASLAVVVMVGNPRSVTVPEASGEEDYLYQEWQDFAKEVDSDFDQEMIMMFAEK